jgi:hypothetical protein
MRHSTPSLAEQVSLGWLAGYLGWAGQGNISGTVQYSTVQYKILRHTLTDLISNHSPSIVPVVTVKVYRSFVITFTRHAIC